TDGAHVVFQGAVKQGKDLPLTSDGESGSFVVQVADASALHPGDDVAAGWAITPAFVEGHGMTGTRAAFHGEGKPLFRRKVVSIDAGAAPQRVTLDVPLRSRALLRDGASVRVETGYLAECGLESLAISNAVAWADAWVPLRVHAIDFLSVKDS